MDMHSLIWKDARNPKRSIDFVRKAGVLVSTVDEAVDESKKLQ
jgi:hypothetical protein